MTITREQIELASGAELDAIGTQLGTMRIKMWHMGGTPGVIHPEPDDSFRAYLFVMFDLERH